MNKKINNAYLNQCTDNAIKRGFEIYDEWNDKKLDSRNVVASLDSAVKLFNKRKTMAAFIDALAHLFALENRIKEKYNTILRCLFSYFSWRRETRALQNLKRALNIPLGETDMRNAIAVELKKRAEKLGNEWNEDGDDDTQGGKSNGKAEDELASKAKEASETVEEQSKADEITDKEEMEKSSEEKSENSVENESQEKSEKELGEQKETAEPQQNEAEKTETDKKEELTQEQNKDLKEEKNVPDGKSEPSKDKKEEAQSYNDLVDYLPLYEETKSEKTAEKTSFIDEMIIDNMVKENGDVTGHDPVDDVKQNGEADRLVDTLASQNEENKSTDNEAYLYDKMVATDKDDAQQTLDVESTKQAEKVSETKTEQPKETIQNNDNVNSTKQEFKTLSEMLQSDNTNVDLDNNIANALNAHMSLESKMSLVRMQEEQLREHMNITLEELGMNDTSDVLRVSEYEQINQPTVTRNIK